MASKTNLNGNWRIQFIDVLGVRQSIRIGRMHENHADRFRRKVERILGGIATGAGTDDDTLLWLTNLPDTTYEKLVRAQLVPERTSGRLGAFIDAYITGRSDCKVGTCTMFRNVRRNLVNFFGENKPLREINPGNADEWRRHLLKTLSDNTVRRRTGIAKQFFRAAHRKKLIVENPFSDLKAAVQANKERDFYVTLPDAQKVLDSCPDAQWRLLFALSRFAGLRCPSEHVELRWADIKWGENRFLVRSCKTEHHIGGEFRYVPLFPAVKKYLDEVFAQAEPGEEFVITRYRSKNQNLRTQLTRIIEKAGLKPWPKLFHNLRANCETDLVEVWPEHVVCSWLGNSRIVARKHYLRVNDDHFARASGEVPAPPALNQAQQSTETLRNEQKPTNGDEQKSLDFPDDAIPCEVLQNTEMSVLGFEPRTP
jgi:integrase